MLRAYGQFVRKILSFPGELFVDYYCYYTIFFCITVFSVFTTGIPYALVNMRTGTSKNFGWASGGSSILSEFGTLHMEFSYLSDITGDPVRENMIVKLKK